jgi:hypothetical protein
LKAKNEFSSFDFVLFHRNIKKPIDMTDRSLTEVTTTSTDYCRLDPKTLKRKPCHRAGFYFYKQNSTRTTKQV